MIIANFAITCLSVGFVFLYPSLLKIEVTWGKNEN